MPNKTNILRDVQYVKTIIKTKAKIHISQENPLKIYH